VKGGTRRKDQSRGDRRYEREISEKSKVEEEGEESRKGDGVELTFPSSSTPPFSSFKERSFCISPSREEDSGCSRGKKVEKKEKSVARAKWLGGKRKGKVDEFEVELDVHLLPTSDARPQRVPGRLRIR